MQCELFAALIQGSRQMIAPQSTRWHTHFEQISNAWIRDALIKKHHTVHGMIQGHLLDLLVIGGNQHDPPSHFRDGSEYCREKSHVQRVGVGGNVTDNAYSTSPPGRQV